MIAQSARTVLMVRPAAFGFNPETAADNAFQQVDSDHDVSEQARIEFDTMVEVLRSEGIDVIVHQDTPEPKKPDAVFPNNWFSLMPDGSFVLYPMKAPNRRLERDSTLINLLRQRFIPRREIDLSSAELHQQFLEGTGSIVFDHLNRKAYASRSMRTQDALFNQICTELEYTPVLFDAFDETGQAYYHTNVLLSIGTRFAIICAEAIPEAQRAAVLDSLVQTRRSIIHITRAQVNAFAGNVLELQNSNAEAIIVLSASAHESLDAHQLLMLSQCGLLLPVFIPTIETIGGGSARCMLAELFEP